jgi:hypothetical protein
MKNMSESPASEIDKEQLYGEWLKSTRWQDKLFRKAAHKSLDIPDDDVQINANRFQSGVNPWIAVAAILASGALGAGMQQLFSEKQTQQVEEQQVLEGKTIKGKFIIRTKDGKTIVEKEI